MPDGLPAEPARLLREWLPANDARERPLMTLATVEDPFPDARSVLLSEWNDDGFFFHTDAGSRKVRQLAGNPAVALCLPMADRGRQLTVQGYAERADPAEETRAYRARSPYLQQLAWQNTDEFAALPQADREREWATFAREHPDGLEPPRGWAGFLVRPVRLTFWFGSADTASRRLEFVRADPTAPWTAVVRAG